MSGELPSALGNCTSLKIIGIKHNNFIGDIPGSIGQLNRLEELQLDNNRMSRVFPSSLSNFTSLKIINLKHNNFTGELSKVNFSRLPNLKLLDLMSNKFTGEILDSIYRCSNLTTLQLSSNKFYGQLSPRIDNLNTSCSYHLTTMFLGISQMQFMHSRTAKSQHFDYGNQLQGQGHARWHTNS
ncbi:Os02g0157501 [Oryza sativa Japonica Group]|uniref:non-specific serine/threonine protein kinase n=1 Tax=Oryza sativa subsp. japonica TaxID=39947 RepID=A0A0P0VET5_ORYSJ|nr:hypothetical protein EE612_008970 [Oryza sativa]BAS77069.1 Os02g0157501 [Oryza sativa Japonica Group]